MKILGIDPGTEKSGWVLYDTSRRIINKGIHKNSYVLEIINDLQADTEIAIEMVASYGQAVGKEVFETVFWIGKFTQLAESKNLNVFRYYKKTDINKAICFNSNVKDTHIRQALLDMFPKTGGGKEPSIGIKKQPGELYGMTSHEFPALAVAITHSIKFEYEKYR